ncbi:MAG TPA: hypothetical protein VFM18_17860 [Methanosarcina sp.]|nr:hypothetical protein [Methanosarcina sp.]
MAKIKPIRPSEVAVKKMQQFPDFVIEAFNQLIAENYNDGARSAVVKQDDAVKRILELATSSFVSDLTPVTRDTVYDKGWLNIEEIFKAAGWKVTYDKPAYNESYPAKFEFTIK